MRYVDDVVHGGAHSVRKMKNLPEKISKDRDSGKKLRRTLRRTVNVTPVLARGGVTNSVQRWNSYQTKVELI